jgi:hypothetical protein
MVSLNLHGKLGRVGFGGYAVLAVVAVQTIVPAVALTGDLPARFGFQMYSGVGGVKVHAVDARGEEISVDLGAEVAEPLRPELDWLAALPERACAAAPSAVRVTVEQSGRHRSVACS